MVITQSKRCLLTSAFFGLGRNYRPVLHAEIHDLVYHGKGGFTHERVYNMPVWLRKFHLLKIQEYHTLIQKENEKGQKSGPSKPGIY